jgi:hypothetical protein
MRFSKFTMVVVALNGAAGFGLAQPRPAVTLRVVNEGGFPRRDLSRAEKETVRIFREAGIDLVWLECASGRAEWGSGNPCQRERGPSEFWVRIVKRAPAATSAEMLGFAELDEGLGIASAGVYYPAAAALAEKWPARIGEILGAAIAHETGHLMLGVNAHSPRGVMVAHWGRAQFELIGISELNFTVAEARELREQIDRRKRS